MSRYALLSILGTAIAITPAGARGDVTAPAPASLLRPPAYALIIGSNRGGPGQEQLQYAEQDARRVAEMLTELGGYASSRVQIMEQPSRTQLAAALEVMAGKLEAHSRRGERTIFFFYYSGHARADGLNLGQETFSLTELRGKLLVLPATVVLTVLDACQSGAFSRVKGSEPAADFSFNSVMQLSTAGIAVMASSGPSELSQESDRLRSSFFTHHLLAALRGVADSDRDGHVTLAEAYRYAYHRTLVDTASTSVGSRHVTLEMGLRGKGELILSYLAEANAQLELPPPLRGDVLIERRPSGSVLAELHKAPGEPMRLGLAPGEYRAFLRKGGEHRECRVFLREGQTTTLDEGRCQPLADTAIAFKGADSGRARWALELAFGLRSNDGYPPQAASEYGFRPLARKAPFSGLLLSEQLALDLTVVRAIHPNLDLLASFLHLDAETYERIFRDGGRERFSWGVFGVGLQLRALVRLWQSGFSLYLQGGAGLSLGRSTYATALSPQGEKTAQSQLDQSWFPGLHWSFSNGLSFTRWQHIGLFAQIRYLEMKAVGGDDYGINERAGGMDVQLGLRLAW
jgi:hypothetical protein